MIVNGAPTLPTNGVAYAKHLRMKLSAGNLVPAVEADANRWLGTLQLAVQTTDTHASICPQKAPGSRYFVASGAIAANAFYKGDDGGKIQTTATASEAEGQTVQAATADGDVILCIPF